MSKRERVTIAILTLAGFVLLWAGYRLLDSVSTFRVSKINITGTNRCDQEKMRKLIGAASYGRCILKVNLSDMYKKIQAMNWVKSVSIRRSLPNTLDIQVSERIPVGIFQSEQTLYLVDKEGVLIESVKDQKTWALPLITGLRSCLGSALQVLKSMKDLKAEWLAEVSEINLKNKNDIILYNKNRSREIRLGSYDLSEKMLYLQTIWPTIKARVSGPIKYIDLRYKNQIIIKPYKVPT